MVELAEAKPRDQLAPVAGAENGARVAVLGDRAIGRDPSSTIADGGAAGG
jgi:hypothetical protein